MTYERAIEILEPTHREKYDDLETVNEACRMGVRALKKQIKRPAKPLFSTSTWAKCPKCGLEIMNETGRYMATQHYCHNCGQALDWSGADD